MHELLSGLEWGIATGHVCAAPPSAAARTGIREPGSSVHARRWSEDLNAVTGAVPGIHRIVAGWPQLQPDGPGTWNAAALGRCDRAVDAMLERGGRPALTLLHLELPPWLEDVGGWLSRDTAERFADYVTRLRDRLADRVELWITSSDLSAVMLTEYVAGLAPNGRCLGAAGLPALHHLLLGIGRGAQVLEGVPGKVGTTVTLIGGYPATTDPFDRLAVERLESWATRLYLDPMLLGTHMVTEDGACPVEDSGCVRDGDLRTIAAAQDVLGLSWHFPSRIAAPENLPRSFPAHSRFEALNEVNRLLARLGFAVVPFDDVETSASGWPIMPEGLADAVASLYDLYGDRLPPLYITDNGLADPEDAEAGSPCGGEARRRSSLAARLSWLAGAMACGVDVFGYEYWSKRDNFDWRVSYSKLYGAAVSERDAEPQPAMPRDWVHEDVFAERPAPATYDGVPATVR
jgi:beta-glucosidase